MTYSKSTTYFREGFRLLSSTQFRRMKADGKDNFHAPNSAIQGGEITGQAVVDNMMES